VENQSTFFRGLVRSRFDFQRHNVHLGDFEVSAGIGDAHFTPREVLLCVVGRGRSEFERFLALGCGNGSGLLCQEQLIPGRELAVNKNGYRDTPIERSQNISARDFQKRPEEAVFE